MTDLDTLANFYRRVPQCQHRGYLIHIDKWRARCVYCNKTICIG